MNCTRCGKELPFEPDCLCKNCGSIPPSQPKEESDEEQLWNEVVQTFNKNYLSSDHFFLNELKKKYKLTKRI